ncbi:hypothetical protein [Arthrobacter sp. ok362]|uniref:hypothetical protein n=1 Tax=Arthrobacter sp. ok362 TaxID=1761745 RepID=UPI00087ECAB1|nr:hypothetical protein [Arthrobacter sp. ok362]SDL83100.1 hypothetical protein SAMN04487913_11598 [Arthrobacter sp. ok362]
MDSNNSDLPGGDPWDDEPSKDTGARRRWPWAAAVVALAVAAVAGGVAVAGNMGSVDRTPAVASTAAVIAPTASDALTATPSPIVATSASVSPSVSPSSSATSDPATPAPSAGAWRTFTSADSKVSFDYPAAWRVSEAAAGAPGYEGIAVDVANEAAVVVASLHVGPSGGLGGACQGDVPYTVLDSVEVDLPHQPAKGSVTPRFAFRALQESDRVTASFGLTDTPAGQNGTTCMFYNVVTGPPEWPLFSFADAFQVNVGSKEDDPMRKGAKTFPSLDAARAYMQTPEYLNAKRMITSLKINAG